MLEDQESKVKQSDQSAKQLTTNNNTDSNNIINNISNNNNNNVTNNPLNDHDYCSPNKGLIKNESSKREDQSHEMSFTASQCTASTSSSPNNTNSNHINLVGQHQASKNANNNDTRSPKKTLNISNAYPKQDGDLSDSSGSSSSSVASSKDLVIDARAKSLAPKDTPSVSRPKLGRVPKLNRNLIAEMNASSSKDKSQPQQGRIRRPRQNTSVTDKSQWLTGEEQIDSAISEHLDDNGREKRVRKEKSVDPEFTQLTSSDYSSSEAESDQESDQDDEDDPNRPWCVCNRPHNDEFMIACDICEYWFHGNCVGITESMSKKFQKAEKEWFCHDCQIKLDSGTEKAAIPRRIPKKEKKPKVSKATGRRRGRPRKSDSAPSKLTPRNTRKSTSSIDSRTSTRRNPVKSNARSQSFEEFEDNQKLKELIRERKKAFFLKRSLMEQQKQSRMRELGIGRQSVTTPSFGSSLDTLASSTSTPNMSNLPINIKSEHKERSKPNIVLQINTKKDASSDQANQRVVTAVVKNKKRKHSESDANAVNDLFTADPLQISRKSKQQEPSSSTISSTNRDGTTSPLSSDRKRTSPSMKLEKTPDGRHVTPKKKRKDSESSSSNGSSTPFGSKQIAKKITDILETRRKQLNGPDVSKDNLEKLATSIEGQLNESFKEGTSKYLNKFRSLIFNLGDDKNPTLVKNVLSGEISPARLVNMKPEELASSELAKWRERENKHSIELIKRDAQMAAQQVIVKKTHKGEEVIAAPALNEPDDPSVGVANQELPTSPTKDAGSTSSKTTAQSPTGETTKSSGTLKLKITSTDSAQNQFSSTSSASIVDSLPFFDTTAEHKNHVFDMNCKICTKQTDNDKKEDSKDAGDQRETKANDHTASVDTISTTQEPQPKRLRISIDTKIDPAKLSRLDQPLIKPDTSATAPEAGSYSPSKISPSPVSNSNEDEEEEELYDPEHVVDQDHHRAYNLSPLGDSNPNEVCWSGPISMPDMGKFNAIAKPISGNVDFMKDSNERALLVCGRIPPDNITSYVEKLNASVKNPILLIQLHPSTDDDKACFEKVFDHLYRRNRCAVIQTNSNFKQLKDFYICPIHEKQNIPEILRPNNGPGLDRKISNCLLGVMIKRNRPTSAPVASTYTPTPINK